MSDLATIITSVTSTLGISAATAWWLGRKWIEHRLSLAKSDWDGDVRKKVDEYLAVRAAEIQYDLEAKQRLYEAIGPLRFQLLLACRDLASRVHSHGTANAAHPIKPTGPGYYGPDTLFRLMRPIAIAELIERQMAYADFAIDPDAVSLLRFKMAVADALSDGGIILDHPSANWGYEEQHLFRNSIPKLANAFVVTEEDGTSRVLQYHELDELLSDDERCAELSNMISLLRDFTIHSKPILWIRLVCYAHLCVAFLRRFGRDVGLEPPEFDAAALLGQSPDSFTQDRLRDVVQAFQSLSAPFESGAGALQAISTPDS